MDDAQVPMEEARGWGEWLMRHIRAFTALEWTAVALVFCVIVVLVLIFAGVFTKTAASPTYPTAWPAWADAAGGAGAGGAANPIANGPIGVVTLISATGAPVLLAFASTGTYSVGAVPPYGRSGAPFPFGAAALPDGGQVNDNVLVWAMDTGSGNMIRQAVQPGDVSGYALSTTLPLHSAFSDTSYAYFVYGPSASGTGGFTVDAVPISAFTLTPGGTAPAVTSISGIGGTASPAVGLFAAPGASSGGLFGGLTAGLFTLTGFYNPLGALGLRKPPAVVLVYTAESPLVAVYDLVAGVYTLDVEGEDLRTAFDANFAGALTPFAPISAAGGATCSAMLASFPLFAQVASNPQQSVPVPPSTITFTVVNTLMGCGAPVKYVPSTSIPQDSLQDGTLPHPPCTVLAESGLQGGASANASALATCAHNFGGVSINETLQCTAWNGLSTPGKFAVYFFVASAGNGNLGGLGSNSGRSSIVRAWDGLTVGPSVPGLSFPNERTAIVPVSDLTNGGSIPAPISICAAPPVRGPYI